MSLLLAGPDLEDTLQNCTFLLEHELTALEMFASIDTDGTPLEVDRSLWSDFRTEMKKDKQLQRAHLRAVIYPTGFEAPVVTDIPSAPGASVEEIPIGDFFPTGCISFRLAEVPGLSFPLVHHYRVFIDNHAQAAPMNKAVHGTFGIPWSGNLIMVRYNQNVNAKEPDRLQHCARSDVGLTNIILALWFREVLNLGLYNDVEIHPEDLAKLMFAAVAHTLMDSDDVGC